THTLALRARTEETDQPGGSGDSGGCGDPGGARGSSGSGESSETGDSGDSGGCGDFGEPGGANPEEPTVRTAVRTDPLAVLAEAAGYDDPERWWEDVVEHRGTGDDDPLAPFAALEEAMGALRETEGAAETNAPSRPNRQGQPGQPEADGEHARDLVREAYMRLQIRAAQRE
ncbi:DUF5682 family protein, partial [Streptomyces sp. TRM76130]|nr:DUF5682 family protein [Streptomyces sp. TRM76130]